DGARRGASARTGGEEGRHPGDGLLGALGVARGALRCAVEVQRLLDRYRREHGSALAVRIGLHATAALPHERDYAGQGVHVAGRVTALAGADEVLATEATLAGAGGHGLEGSPPRQATLKGGAAPVTGRSVDWAGAARRP